MRSKKKGITGSKYIEGDESAKQIKTHTSHARNDIHWVSLSLCNSISFLETSQGHPPTLFLCARCNASVNCCAFPPLSLVLVKITKDHPSERYYHKFHEPWSTLTVLILFSRLPPVVYIYPD